MVPRDERNRRLEVAVLGYTSSTRQLDGEDSRITFEFPFAHIPCGVEEVACQVIGTDGSKIARQRVEVKGCEP